MNAIGVGRTLTLSIAVVLVAAVACRGQGDAPPRTGVLTLPWERFDVLVCDQSGSSSLHTGRNGEATLPAGTYPRYRLTLRTTDKDGVAWEMNSAYWYETLLIEAGRTTELEIGTPFDVRLRPSRYRIEPGQDTRFGLAVSDAKGREWRMPQPRGARRSRPQLILATEDGRQLGEFAFEYG